MLPLVREAAWAASTEAVLKYTLPLGIRLLLRLPAPIRCCRGVRPHKKRVGNTLEYTHVDAQFGNDDRSQSPIYTTDFLQQRELGCIGLQLLLDTLFESRQVPLRRIESLLLQPGKRKRWCSSRFPSKANSRCGILLRSLPLGSSAISVRVALPSTKAFKIRAGLLQTPVPSSSAPPWSRTPRFAWSPTLTACQPDASCANSTGIYHVLTTMFALILTQVPESSSLGRGSSHSDRWLGCGKSMRGHIMGAPNAAVPEVISLAGVFTDLLVALGICDDPSAPALEFRSLVSTPWTLFQEDRRLCSPLTESGAPFEISLQLKGNGDPVLRYVVDTADRRETLAANRPRYFDQARAITAASETELQALFERHLGGAPAKTPARVMHGVGFARGGRRRTSLYFPMNWIDPDELARRLRDQMAELSRAHALLGLPPAQRLEVAGYDFVGTKLARWKTYSWLKLVEPSDFVPLAKAYPSLRPAVLLYETFLSQVAPLSRDRALFLQLAGDASGIQGKLFFFSWAWGWSGNDGLLRLIGFLDETFDLDFKALLQVRDAATRNNFALMMGLIAIGGDIRSPSVTFYFWPA